MIFDNSACSSVVVVVYFIQRQQNWKGPIFKETATSSRVFEGERRVHRDIKGLILTEALRHQPIKTQHTCTHRAGHSEALLHAPESSSIDLFDGGIHQMSASFLFFTRPGVNYVRRQIPIFLPKLSFRCRNSFFFKVGKNHSWK